MNFSVLNMAYKRCLDMINVVTRNGKYRYIVIAVLILNVLLINQLFTDKSILSSNHFKLSSLMNDTPEPWILTGFNSTHSIQQNGTKGTKPVTGSHTPIEFINHPEFGPPNTKALLSIKDYDFNGPFVGWPLQRVCTETKQTPGLVFLCDNNSGGIGNIRNFILTCIRYAIEAGASGLVVPKIQRRSDKELSNIFTTGFQPFDYFFDEQHFKQAMSSYCPQIVVYDEFADIPNVGRIRKAKDFYPKHLNKDFDGCDERGLNRHIDKFRPKFDEWLVKTNRTVTTKTPLSIRLKWATFFEWPIYRDGPEFANTFGDLLRIRSDIKQLAAATIKELSVSMGLEPNPSAIEATFLGAHLRTESDALSFWPKFDQQSDGYLEQATRRNLSHIYLASGNATDSKRFATRAWDMLKIKVTSKNELLKGKELATLQSLSWDQQGVVDYLVLQKSTFFSGCSFSSFAMNIAVKRHSMSEGIHTRQWKSPGDEYSWLVGPFESWFGDWMFMLECLWP